MRNKKSVKLGLECKLPSYFELVDARLQTLALRQLLSYPDLLVQGPTRFDRIEARQGLSHRKLRKTSCTVITISLNLPLFRAPLIHNSSTSSYSSSSCSSFFLSLPFPPVFAPQHLQHRQRSLSFSGRSAADNNYTTYLLPTGSSY